MSAEPEGKTLGPLVVLQPEDGKSFWQPVPANGFVRCMLASSEIGAEANFGMGTQTVDPGCHVREHFHEQQEEVIFVLEGLGHARIEGKTHPMRKGTCFFLGKGRVHSFHADPSGPMTFMWLLMPSGLETFFARIGRKKIEGDPPPAPFPRPADVLQIEAETVFGKLKTKEPAE